MDSSAPTFDAAKYKRTTHDQWQGAAEAWFRWSFTLQEWLGGATETLFDMAEVSQGQRVLDVAAGAGEQSIRAARRVAPGGSVLATDLSPRILEFATRMAAQAGVTSITTQAMDGEQLELADDSFDVVISRVGLIYFPDQQRALKEMLRVLKLGGRVAAIVYSTPDRNTFFSVPVGIIRRRANLPPPLPGQPGPFSLGAEGALERAFEQAGFTDVRAVRVSAPLKMASAAECVRFERESFGALHQMLSGLSDRETQSVWEEIERELGHFESERGFSGPCELVLGVGRKA